ncbi:MAG: FKBP-type peptidyl-prolyl cis-trans isomerase [Gammaproteobacteria bacterium]|nr:FKBP-type peptidyl-prolyl cis-trans isomerase [Gammaproteobacteria bacterium]
MSYGAGYALASSVQDQLDADFDADGFKAGIADALAGVDLRVSDDELEQARDDILARRASSEGQRAAVNLDAARAFMAENANRDEVTVTASGLQYQVLAEGEEEAPRPSADSEVVTHYTGRLLDGTVFDSSEVRGQPATFGVSQVIAGWQEALQLMKVGDRLRIWLPPELAYGERGAGRDIPPNAALEFDVELLEIVR